MKFVLYFVSFFYLIFHPFQTFRVLQNLLTVRSFGGTYIFGPEGGSGGTKFVSENFYNRILEESEVNTFLFQGQLLTQAREGLDDERSFLHIVDSKITLMMLLFKGIETLNTGIYVWNSFDFNFHAAKILSTRHRIIVFDFDKRNSNHGISPAQWCESLDLRFDSVPSFSVSNSKHNPAKSFNFIGRLTYQKGIDLFLDIAKDNPGVIFRIFGAGPFRHVVEQNALKYTNIVFEGYIPNVLENLTIDDVVVVPSRFFEGPSLLVLEALARGNMVISTGVDNLSLIKNDNHFIPKRKDEFSKFLQKFINDSF